MTRFDQLLVAVAISTVDWPWRICCQCDLDGR